MNDFNKCGFTNDLMNWYKINKRHLPWRVDSNPYRIWISEIMLQQTQVDTVIPYYERFMQRFPTIPDLAHASLEAVYKAWEGLGYYSRARHLHESANWIMEHNQGVFPQSFTEIIQLKGIGSYTAGAIASIAFQQKVPAVDGNVMRVMSRVWSLWEDIALLKTKKKLEIQISDLLPEDTGTFNQALMELGAIVCKPKGPKCRFCPISAYCTSYQEGYEDELPVKNNKTKQLKQVMISGILTNQKGEFLMRKRHSEGLLANLWEFIQVEGHDFSDLQFYLKDHADLELSEGFFLEEIKHVFSHRIWIMNVYQARVLGKEAIPPHLHWMSKADILTVPLSTAHKKIYDLIEK